MAYRGPLKSTSQRAAAGGTLGRPMSSLHRRFQRRKAYPTARHWVRTRRPQGQHNGVHNGGSPSGGGGGMAASKELHWARRAFRRACGPGYLVNQVGKSPHHTFRGQQRRTRSPGEGVQQGGGLYQACL